MAICLLNGSLVSGTNRWWSRVVLPVLGLTFATASVRAEDDRGRPESARPAPAGHPTPAAPQAPPAPVERQVPSSPPDPAMTLDQAVDRLLRENLELRACHDEIAMAEADVEAAGQPPRPSLFISVGMDGIGATMARAPALFPRAWAETMVARAARRVVEAQYQNAVRIKLDELYGAFVDIQVAQNRREFARRMLQGVEQLLETVKRMQQGGVLDASDGAQMKAERELAANALGDAEADLKKDRLILGNLLNLPDAQVERLRVSDLQDVIRPDREPPVAQALIRIAMYHRPDLRADRLGVERARADWFKALVEPLSQITFVAWPDPLRPRQPRIGLAAVITLPTTTRNGGVLKKAVINVEQTRTQLAKIERDIILDVRKTRLEYGQARAAVDRFRDEIIPAAQIRRTHQFQLFRQGKVSLANYLEAQAKYNEIVRAYLEVITRLRRSTLALNTAVGERIMR